MVRTAEEVRQQLKEMGYACSLINARFVKPIDEELILEIERDHCLIVTLEENVKSGGFGEKVLDYLNQAGSHAKVLNIALPDDYVEHGNVDVPQQEVGKAPC